MIDDNVGLGFHAAQYAIIGTLSQVRTSDNRDCEYRTSMANGRMANRPALQPEAAHIFDRLSAANISQKALADALGIAENKVSKMRNGERQFQAPEILRAMSWLDEIEAKMKTGKRPDAPDQQPTRSADNGEVVEIIALDLSLPMGPGATVDDYVEEEPVKFDLSYVQAFTRTPPHRLRIARGVGESMFPTLQNSDLVWIDSTQTALNQQDRIWAVSIHGAAAIKRLRMIGKGRVLIMSDNKDVGDQEVGLEDILIGGRVLRFSRDV